MSTNRDIKTNPQKGDRVDRKFSTGIFTREVTAVNPNCIHFAVHYPSGGTTNHVCSLASWEAWCKYAEPTP